MAGIANIGGGGGGSGGFGGVSGTTYNVNVNYRLNTSQAQSQAGALAGTFDRLAEAVTGAFAVHKILDFGARLTNLQAQSEGFQLALSTMLTGFGAPGFTKGAADFQKAMQASAGLMNQIRQDAASLPGTAEDLMEIMRAAMPGGIRAGQAVMGRPDSILEMSKRLMASANLLQIPGGSTTVAREFQALMEGRAQTRNDLFARIRGLMNDGKGIDSKSFNALGEEGRWKQVNDALKKLVDPALPTYATTWKAISTTTQMWAQQIARVATGGMFDTLKLHLKELNDWFGKNRTEVEGMVKSFGQLAGDALGKAFDMMKDAFAYIVQNKETILKVVEGLGVAMLFMGMGKNPLVNAGLGVAANAATGGDAFGGVVAGTGAALMSLGGAAKEAGAALLALQLAANWFDKTHKEGINRETETKRLTDIMSRGFIGANGYENPASYGVLKQIIQENKLNSGYLGAIDNAKLNEYLDKNADITNPKLRFDLGDAFDYAARRLRESTALGPDAPNEAQKAMQALFEKSKRVPEKPNLNLTVNIKQDISQAEDPDRILVRTKQAIEDALIRPIESGNNRFSVLR